MHERPSSAESADLGVAGWSAVGVTAHAAVAARMADIPRLRDLAPPEGAPAPPPRFLRHADEQTVVGLRAVLAAIAAIPAPRPSFAAHAVVAAPCRSGRFTAAQSLMLFRSGGGVTVTPHVVPQCSLHSLAGAVSVALGMHGPNIGVGGGRHAVAEGLAVSLALLAPAAGDAGSLPGVWFVATAWDEEPPLDESGRPLDAGTGAGLPREAVCRGIALVLEAEAGPASRPLARLAVHHARPVAADDLRPADSAGTSAGDIRRLAGALAASPVASVALPCPWGEEFRMGPAPAATVAAPRRHAA
jgi:hypothetical protein